VDKVSYLTPFSFRQDLSELIKNEYINQITYLKNQAEFLSNKINECKLILEEVNF
jgi:hypothetical protein